MKRLAILGSTGSIGRQALDVVRQHPHELKVQALAANRSSGLLLSQAAEFDCTDLALVDEQAAALAGLPGGPAAVESLATHPDVDTVVVAVAGVAGLGPTLAAITAGKDIALASKEVLVAAGQVVMPLVQARGVTLTPIDSEHSAVFQCLQGYERSDVAKVILTASGGPFRGRRRADLASVTADEALNHPTWRMGGKITVDSATLMNKGLEVIEAHWLFGVAVSQVEVVVHPQSIVHSFVQFKDTSVLAQLGWPDMRLPIQYALLYPRRAANALKPWSPLDTPSLSFEPLDEETFPGPRLARQSASTGQTAPCVFNAANEEAANLFLQGKCGFLQISELVEETLELHRPVEPSLANLLAADAWARETVRRKLKLE